MQQGGIILILGLLFVSSVYWIPLTRRQDRNSSQVILLRILSVGIATLMCIIITLAYSDDAFNNWGLNSPSKLYLCTKSFLFSVSIFSGQLALDLYLGTLTLPSLSLLSARNLFFGPVFEEIVFRGCMINLISSYSQWEIYVYPSLIFGLSHIHHGIYEYLRGKYSISQSINSCLFQFLYTFMFGLFATFYYLSTGSILSVIILHSVCNHFGIPDFEYVHYRGDARIKSIFWGGNIVGMIVLFNVNACL